MKKVTFFLSLLSLGLSSAFAQSYDVGIIDIPNVTANTTVYPNQGVNVQYTRENFGTTDVTSAVVDSFTIEISVGGNKIRTFYRNMNGNPFAAGATETTQGQFGFFSWGDQGLSAGSFQLCVRTRLWKNGSLIDANPGNDELCINLTYAGDNSPLPIELGVSNVQLVLPGFPAGSKISSSANLQSLSFDITNNGNQIDPGLQVACVLKIGSEDHPFTLTVNDFISSPGTVTATLSDLDDPNLWPSMPSFPGTAGEFDICVEITDAADSDNTNNESCTGYEMQGTGIEDVVLEDVADIFYSNGFLNLEFNQSANSSATVEIFEITGRQVMTENLDIQSNKSHSIDVSGLNTGMHIANISINGEVKAFRFVK